MARPGRILPRACGSPGMTPGPNAARRLLQPEQPVSTPTDRPIPGAFVRWSASGLRRTGSCLRKGLRPLRLHRRRLRVACELPRRSQPCGRLTAHPQDASQAFSGQRPAGSRRPAPRAVPLESGRRSFAPTRYGSDTSRCKTAVATGGVPGTTPRSAEAGTALSAVSPHQPAPSSKRWGVGWDGLSTACFREAGSSNIRTRTACAAHIPTFETSRRPACADRPCP